MCDDLTSSDVQKQADKDDFIVARKKHWQLCHRQQASTAQSTFQNLETILSKDPAFKLLRQLKSTKSGEISELKVVNKVFHGEQVAEWFYETFSKLKPWIRKQKTVLPVKIPALATN